MKGGRRRRGRRDESEKRGKPGKREKDEDGETTGRELQSFCWRHKCDLKEEKISVLPLRNGSIFGCRDASDSSAEV